MQYWMVSPRLSVVEAANRSIEEFEEPLWWWKVGSGGAWLWRSNLTQKFFQASCLLGDDLMKQLESAPMMILSPGEMFARRYSVMLEIDSRKSSSWPAVGA